MDQQSNGRVEESGVQSAAAQSHGGSCAGGGPVNKMLDEDQEDQLIQQTQQGIFGSPHSSGSTSDFGGYTLQGGLGEEIEKNLDEASIVLESESAAFQQRIWGSFQNCARGVTQVYMTSKYLQSSSDHQHRNIPPESCASRTPSPQQAQPSKTSQQVEESFKSAAQHATSLYKDSIETSRRLIDLAKKTGSCRRTKELLSFVKSKKKRFIKKEELLSFLIGGSWKKEGGPSLSCRSKNHGGSVVLGGPFGGALDLSYSHVLHHVHSGGGITSFPQNLSLCQQQSHQTQPQHHSSCSQSAVQPPQQSPQSRLSDAAPFPQFNSSIFTPRKHSNDLHPAASNPKLVISNNTSLEETDPSSMLHLAVQQLFVAGAAGGTPNEFVHVAGVKRPAEDTGGKKREDDEDCVMEDNSVDGGSDCFKRMRFH